MKTYALDSIDVTYLKNCSDLTQTETNIFDLATKDGDLYLTRADYKLPDYSLGSTNFLLATDHDTLVRAYLQRHIFEVPLSLDTIVAKTKHVPPHAIENLLSDLEKVQTQNAFQTLTAAEKEATLEMYCVLFDAKFVSEAFQSDFADDIETSFYADMDFVAHAILQGHIVCKLSDELSNGTDAQFVQTSATTGEVRINSKTPQLSDFIVLHESVHIADALQGRQFGPAEAERRGYFVECIYVDYTGQSADHLAQFPSSGTLSASNKKNQTKNTSNMKFLLQKWTASNLSPMERIQFFDALLRDMNFKTVTDPNYFASARSYAQSRLQGVSLADAQKAQAQTFSIAYAKSNAIALSQFVSPQFLKDFQMPGIVLVDRLNYFAQKYAQDITMAKQAKDKTPTEKTQILDGLYAAAQTIALFQFISQETDSAKCMTYFTNTFLPNIQKPFLEYDFHQLK